MKEIEIIKLLKLGKPLSIKTRKQGRRKSLEEYNKEDKHIGINNAVHIYYRKPDALIAKNNCHRILNYEHSTIKQKEVATRFLKEIESTSVDIGNITYAAKLLSSIARTLSIKDRRF